MKSFWSDFKAFIAKGNVMDMAVGVIIGAAFGKIVTSLVNDIIMPLISLLTGGIDFSDWKWVIKPATATSAETALTYGNFINAVIDFLIVALCIFCVLCAMVKAHDRLEKLTSKKVEEEQKEEEEKAETTEELLTQIRDLLSKSSAGDAADEKIDN